MYTIRLVTANTVKSVTAHEVINNIYLNFIGAFEVSAHIVTPAEVEEQRRRQEEQEAERNA